MERAGLWKVYLWKFEFIFHVRESQELKIIRCIIFKNDFALRINFHKKTVMIAQNFRAEHIIALYWRMFCFRAISDQMQKKRIFRFWAKCCRFSNFSCKIVQIIVNLWQYLARNDHQFVIPVQILTHPELKQSKYFVVEL